MKIQEQRTVLYTLYLSEEEFAIFAPVVIDKVPCGYRFDNKRKEFIVTADSEEMISDIEDALDSEHYIQKYEECDSFKADMIKDMIDDIYMAVERGYTYDPDEDCEE